MWQIVSGGKVPISSLHPTNSCSHSPLTNFDANWEQNKWYIMLAAPPRCARCEENICPDSDAGWQWVRSYYKYILYCVSHKLQLQINQ